MNHVMDVVVGTVNFIRARGLNHRQFNKLLDETDAPGLPYHTEIVVVVGYPTPSEGWGMAEDHGAPEARQLPRVWTRGRKETESRQRVSGANSP